MKRVFEVTIIYEDETSNVLSVIAKNDVEARAIAIKLDAGEGSSPVDYCETKLVVETSN